jgi:hypothetical protein
MILEHLLLGSEKHGTLATACGRPVSHEGDYYDVGRRGLNTALAEGAWTAYGGRKCQSCVRAWARILRSRQPQDKK